MLMTFSLWPLARKGNTKQLPMPGLPGKYWCPKKVADCSGKFSQKKMGRRNFRQRPMGQEVLKISFVAQKGTREGGKFWDGLTVKVVPGGVADLRQKVYLFQGCVGPNFSA